MLRTQPQDLRQEISGRLRVLFKKKDSLFWISQFSTFLGEFYSNFNAADWSKSTVYFVYFRIIEEKINLDDEAFKWISSGNFES